MIELNRHYAELKDSYLFAHIAQKVSAYQQAHPNKSILRLGIGDVTLPLCDAVIAALHEAADDQAAKETFRGYQPECGAPFLRQAIANHYRTRGIELGDIAGRTIVHLPSGRENGFLPEPSEEARADLIYLCSPNNPTGAVFGRDKLQRWVDFANERGSIILFDAAYEAFVEDDDLPRSIMELDGAKSCAIEICSLSKTAGFTGTRAGYTVIPKELVRGGMRLNDMWVRNRTTKTNGVSYVLQKGAAAVFTPEGQQQVRENLRYYKENARILMKALDEVGVWYCGGKNAPYLWLECPAGMDGWQFFDYLLNEIQVVGTPGEGFGSCGKGHFRFSTFGSRENTLEAAERLRALLA